MAEQVSTVVEIGLAYGSSALAIGEALVAAAPTAPSHLVVDAYQESVWSNAGWELIRQAGLDSFTTLVTEPSQLALPRLVAEGRTVDAAFVDGSHVFHEVFFDLYCQRVVYWGGVEIGQ